MRLQRGDWVRLLAYGDEVIERRLVEVRGRHVYVCTDEEYRAAAIDGREPVAVGFPLALVRGEGAAVTTAETGVRS